MTSEERTRKNRRLYEIARYFSGLANLWGALADQALTDCWSMKDRSTASRSSEVYMGHVSAISSVMEYVKNDCGINGEVLDMLARALFCLDIQVKSFVGSERIWGTNPTKPLTDMSDAIRQTIREAKHD